MGSLFLTLIQRQIVAATSAVPGRGAHPYIQGMLTKLATHGRKWDFLSGSLQRQPRLVPGIPLLTDTNTALEFPKLFLDAVRECRITVLPGYTLGIWSYSHLLGRRGQPALQPNGGSISARQVVSVVDKLTG